MKYEQAMRRKDKPKWNKVVKDNYGNFATCNIVKAVTKEEVPDDATIIGSTWEMKK